MTLLEELSPNEVIIFMPVDQDPVMSRPPLRYKPLSRPAVSNPLSQKSRGYDYTCYLRVAIRFGGLVAEGFVAERPRLLQTYVTKWQPKPVTNPMF